MAYIIYHNYVSEPHDTYPSPAVQYAYSCVTYTANFKGLTDCEWIIPGTLESAEKLRSRIAQMKARRQHNS